MTSQEYWRIRAELTEIFNEKSVLEYERDLKRAYDSTMLRIQKEIDAFYQKYAENHQMDLASARQRIQDLNLEDFRTQQEDYLKEAEKFGADPGYIEYLKELSSRAYITKLQEIQMNIRHQIEKLTAEYHDRGEMLLKEGYEDSFYRTLFDIQKQAGIGIDFTAPGARQLEKAVKTKWLGENFSSRVWKNKNALLAQLDQLIPQDFVRGRGNREVAKDIATRLQTSYHNAARLVRTEMNHISNQATLDSYRASGIVEEYEYLATLDNRTSDICRELDEKHFPLKQAQTGVNLPPMHPYCRSTTIPYFPEDDLSKKSDRIARNEEGKSYFVGKDVSYQEWVDMRAAKTYAERVAKNPKKYAEMNDSASDIEVKQDAIMKNYQKHSEKWMKEVVLAKISESEAQDIAAAMKELIDNNDFCMRVSPQALLGILESGKFKNQFETGTSNGLFSPETRKSAAKALFGASTSTLKPEEYEVYGYLGLKDKEEEFYLESPIYEGIQQYGGIAITFKKDRLKGHVTYTCEDSLRPALRGKTIVGDTSKPSAAGITSYSLKNAANTAKTWESEYELNPFWVSDEVFRGSYIELQYTRKPTLQDIEVVTIPKEHWSLDDDQRKLLTEKLAELEIPFVIV